METQETSDLHQAQVRNLPGFSVAFRSFSDFLRGGNSNIFGKFWEFPSRKLGKIFTHFDFSIFLQKGCFTTNQFLFVSIFQDFFVAGGCWPNPWAASSPEASWRFVLIPMRDCGVTLLLFKVG